MTPLPPNAFLTGSRAYGIPHEKSDIDIVILISEEALANIFSIGPVTEDDRHYGSVETGVTIRHDNLNLIFVATTQQFNCWKDGTNHLKSIAPVTRDEAVAYFAPFLEKLQGKKKVT
jgi:hypothetical protein